MVLRILEQVLCCCVCPGPLSPLAQAEACHAGIPAALPSIHGTWPTHSCLAHQTNLFVPNNVGGKETAASALQPPDSACWEKKCGMGERESPPTRGNLRVRASER